MQIYQIFMSELHATVRYKVLTVPECEEFLEKVKDLDKEEKKKRILQHMVFNLNTDISASLNMMSRAAAYRALDAIYSGIVMLNPSIDLDYWLTIAYMTAPNVEDIYDQDSDGDFDEEEEKNLENIKNLIKKTRNAKQVQVKSKKITRQKFLGLEFYLKKHVVGQDEAIQEIVTALTRSQAGLNDENRPLGVFLFAGASGVGKTQLARCLNQYLNGNDSHLVRIDCGEYQHKHENQKLTGCFAENSMVLMSNGIFKEIQSIKVGDEVFSHTGLVRPVVDTYKYEFSGNLKKISVSGISDPIICTPEHEIFSVKTAVDKSLSIRHFNRVVSQSAVKDNLNWISASELSEFDWLAVPRPLFEDRNEIVFDLKDYIPLIGTHSKYKYDEQSVWTYENKRFNRFIKLDENFARLAGYYISEGGGSKSRKTFNFTFNIKEKEYIDEVINLVDKVFGISTYKILDRSERNSYRIYFHSRVVSNFLSTLFGDNTYKKKIPIEFFNSSESVKFNLIETMILGDGCTKIPNRVGYSTVSQELFSGLITMMRQLGLSPWEIKEKNRFRVFLSGKTLLSLKDKVSSLFDFTFTESLNRESRCLRYDDQYIYHRIISVEDFYYDGSVYDISVGEDTSYTINGIAVHNSPPGYVGHDEGGHFINQVKKNPNSVILIDEVEKAHPDIWNTFLTMFDEGKLTDNKGDIINFHNNVIIMTTNLGNDKTVEHMLHGGAGFTGTVDFSRRQTSLPRRELVTKNTLQAIDKYFKPEFVNRIDKIVVFNHLTREDCEKIAEMEMNHVAEKLSKKGMTIHYTQNVINKLIDLGIDSIKGARGIAQVRREKIETNLAKEIVYNTMPKGTMFYIDCLNEDFVFDVQKPKSKTLKE